MIDHAEFARQFDSLSVVMLRKAAAGRVPNYRKMRKPELVDAMAAVAFTDAQHEAAKKATEKPAKATKAKTQSRTQTKATPAAGSVEKAVKPAYKSTKAPKIGRKVCEICKKRPAVSKRENDGIEGMCRPCYEYAGWENTHSDNNHEAILAKDSRTGDELDEIQDCPVCQGNDPANDDVQTKANGSKPGRKVTKPMAVASKSFDAKAKAFAAIAKEAGWKSRVHEVSKTAFQVIATSGSESVTMVWDNGAYQYDMSQHKDEKGRKAKIRNASAARKILDA